MKRLALAAACALIITPVSGAIAKPDCKAAMKTFRAAEKAYVYSGSIIASDNAKAAMEHLEKHCGVDSSELFAAMYVKRNNMIKRGL